MKKYDSYKDSGIEWIGEIPEHWEVKKLKYLSYIKTGYTPSKDDKENYDEAGVVWAKPDDLKEYLPIIDSKERISEIGLKKQNLIPKYSILVCCIGSVGKFGIAGCDLVTNQQINSIVFNESTNTQFGKYLIGASIIEHDRNSNGNVVKILNSENQKNIFFPLPPPLEEQTSIASFLDRKTSEIDEIIADKKRLLELYEEEKTAIINQAVTKGIDPDAPMKDSGIEWLGEIPEHWEVKRFKYYFDLITEKAEDNEDLPKIGLENIESKTGMFIESNSDFAGIGVQFKENDILFGKLRPYLAKVWLSNTEAQAVGDFYVFRSKNEVSPEFAKYRIIDKSFIEVTNNSTYGSKMPRVSWGYISDLPIAFPSIDEQFAILQHIKVECSRIDFKKARTEELIELLTEYRAALISEAVTGKIKVTEDQES